jgi:hypothetical protein
MNPGLVLKFESSRQPNLRNGIQRPQKIIMITIHHHHLSRHPNSLLVFVPSHFEASNTAVVLPTSV